LVNHSPISRGSKSIGNDTATIGASVLLRDVDSSKGSIATIDVIASIDALLEPHKTDLQLSGGKHMQSNIYHFIFYFIFVILLD
jgi:hypothetical protein